MRKIVGSEKEMRDLGRGLARKILTKENVVKRKEALVIGLKGELGSGKTVFVRGFLKELGVKKKITSPTFVLMRRYPLSGPNPAVGGTSLKQAFHIDAYRIKNEKEILELGWKNIFKNPENIILIEWPENIGKLLKGIKIIRFEHLDINKRIIEIGKF